MTDVSIIIPTFNRGTLLLEAVESCLSQHGVEVEVIVVDDGSTDGSAAKTKTIFPQIKLIRQENQGACVARNRGLQEANGEFIKFLDSDDMLAPDVLKRQVECLRRTGADAAYGDFEMVGVLEDSRVGGQPLRITGEVSDLIDALLGEWWCAPFCYLYRAGALSGITWREDLSCLQDFEFVLQVVLAERKFIYSPGIDGYYRIHSGQITNAGILEYARNRRLILDDLVTALENSQQLTENRRELIAHGYWAAARAFYRSDKERFEQTVRIIENLVPRFSPSFWGPLPVRVATKVLGIRRAEVLLALGRRLLGRT